MSELNEIKRMLEGLASDVKEIKDSMARHDDVMAMRDTLENMTVEFAASLDDKREAGDVLLKSHFDYAYEDIKQTKEFVQQGFQETAENFQQLFKIMESWLNKQKGMDEIQRFQHERITNQEKQTELLWQEVNRLKKKISGDSGE
jgi:hypothetical protein